MRFQQGAARAECEPAAPVVCNLLAGMGLPGAPRVQHIFSSLFSASAVPEQLGLPVLQQTPASPWGAEPESSEPGPGTDRHQDLAALNKAVPLPGSFIRAPFDVNQAARG